MCYKLSPLQIAAPAAVELHRVEVMRLRSEKEIFEELLGLCDSPGYVHALSMLSVRDNFIQFGRELKAKDMDHLFSRSRLIRTEFTTLIGLLIRKPIDFNNPGLDVLQDYISRTDALLAELHRSISAVMFDHMHTAGRLPEPPTHPDPLGAGHARTDFLRRRIGLWVPISRT